MVSYATSFPGNEVVSYVAGEGVELTVHKESVVVGEYRKWN